MTSAVDRLDDDLHQDVSSKVNLKKGLDCQMKFLDP
jgi:hypothetical protein